MVQLEEISDEVAERLKISQSQKRQQEEKEAQEEAQAEALFEKAAEKAAKAQQQQQQQQQQNASSSNPSVAGPELSPGRATEANKTVDEVVADLRKTPFFMNELVENDETEALKALAYEGTPLENGASFKDQGNDYFKVKRWADAKEFYTKGIQVLAPEERRRQKIAAGEEPEEKKPEEEPKEYTEIVVENGQVKEHVMRPVKEEEGDKNPAADQEAKEPETEEEIASQRKLLETLYSNRSACHLELRNYRSSWLDGAAALRLNPQNVKAYYRSAKALLAVSRISDAREACEAGLAAVDPANAAALSALRQEIDEKDQEAKAKQKRDQDREAKQKKKELAVKLALRRRGIVTRTTDQPPEMEGVGIKLVPQEDDPDNSELAFPVVFLYPLALESDFVKEVPETSTLGDHLSYILPLPWDKVGGEYSSPEKVECFAETREGGLVKIGKNATVGKTLGTGKIEVVDEVLRFFVLPKSGNSGSGGDGGNKAEGWVREFKEKKKAERGGV